ncbi:hypothetical protein [Candidatus Enterococcus ikei]|uniref:Lipoprotein n=1 Tax=Candidatus Enterococcus ikei TaxID=2815326 RepID=A0ABS3GUJ0_9ENTE|nr:hypothetical protein [Enterococcus sp. DIV0869a]MBO0438918.1 hypothetical protein [Enterococcus sp. DIV0869a]
MKKIVILSLLSGLFLVGCGSNSDKKTESTSPKTSESSTAQADKDKQKNIEIAVNSLKKGFSAYHDISFDKKTKSFILKPKEELSETETLKKVADSPTEPKHEETLKNIASNFIELSTTISENIGKDYKIKLKYPGDNNRDIFVIQDGNISYPIINEFKNKKSSSNAETSESVEVQSSIDVENQRVADENAKFKVEEEASKAAVQAQYEEDQRKADEFNAKLQADVEAENARVEAEVQAAQKAEQDRVDAENQRMAEQDRANGY